MFNTSMLFEDDRRIVDEVDEVGEENGSPSASCI